MSAGTNIATLVESTPALVFTDPAKADELFAHIEQEIAAFIPDVETVTGRKAIASLAYKVSRTKTAIDDAGAELIEEANKKVKSVNGERKRMRDKLDALRDHARQPLDAWETAEEERKTLCQSIINNLRNAGAVAFDDTSESVIGRLAKLEAFEIDEAKFGDFSDTAKDVRKQSIAALEAARDRLLKDEADRAELERLRSERAERERADAERAAEAAAEEARQAQERHAEERRQQAEAEAQQRADAAAESARQEAARAAEEAQRRTAAAHAEELRRAEQEKADLIAQQQREREAAARATREQAVADAARAADQEHRSSVMRASKEAIMEAAGIGEDKAKKIVLAIAAGNVPHTTINF